MKDYLKTMRPQGIQQQMQEHPNDKEKKMHTYLENEIEKHGNSDTKALAAVYHEFTKDGKLSNEEIHALKTMDKALKGVELISGFDSDVALVVQDQGNTSFLLNGTALTQKNKGNAHSK